jgi:cell division protein FtsB
MSEGETLTNMTVYLGTTKMNSFSSKVKNKNKIKTKKTKNSFNFSLIILILFSFLISLILFYAFTVNRVATMGYNIKVTEKKINNLKNDNDNLKIKISELKSMKVLENKALEIGMAEPQEIDYLNVVEGLALKK